MSSEANTTRATLAPDGGFPLSRALGWFGIGLGLAQVVLPRRVARGIGVRGTGMVPALVRGLGLREITSGVGVLSGHRPDGWMWSRVAGDAIDLSLLAAAFGRPRVRRRRLATATVAVAGVTALDVLCSTRLRRTADSDVHIVRSITVNRSPEEVYRFWHDLENLPRFMRHLELVFVHDAGRSHWIAKGPAGTSVEWDAEIVEDRPNELIAWRSVDGTPVQHSGRVRFVPVRFDRGTRVCVELTYRLPAGAIGSTIARALWAAPEQEIAADLRSFKQVMETGDIVRSDASIHAAPHPAQPAAPKVVAR